MPWGNGQQLAFVLKSKGSTLPLMVPLYIRHMLRLDWVLGYVLARVARK